jgi:putative Mg2+ transporter-C (MgtC) family protein
VVGLTTAATIFVMASVGMAIGGGLYGVAIFTTALILVILIALGIAEARYEKKTDI